MAFNESFGHLKVDLRPQETPPGWEGEVPHLDYWSIKYNHGKLTEAQKRFYEYVKTSLQDGFEIKNYIVQRYLLLYRDELLKKINKSKSRQTAIDHIVAMRKIYGFSDFQLEELLRNEAENLRKHRVNYYKKNDMARWVPFSEAVDTASGTLTRGGFYLGPVLACARYDTLNNKFFKSEALVEGPVINLDVEIIERYPSSSLEKSFSTFVEMPQPMQTALLEWLKGDTAPTVETLAYYLSGIEFRLLADRDTTDAERRDIIIHLYDMLSQPWSLKVRPTIVNLIDLTLTRYFLDEAEEILELYFVDSLPMLRYGRVGKVLANADYNKTDYQSVAAAMNAAMKLPSWLPDVYADAFATRIKSRLWFDLSSRGAWIETDKYKYRPIKTSVYVPTDTIKRSIESMSARYDSVSLGFYNRVADAYDTVYYELDAFRKKRISGATALAASLALPSWCDPKLMPGVNDSFAGIVPATTDGVTEIQLSEVLEIFDLKGIDAADVMEALQYQLYRMGLRLGPTLFGKIKLQPDETVTIYHLSCGDLPKRGSLRIVLFLLGWMLAADKIRGRELQVADRWIDETDHDNVWRVPAKALVHWLAKRKMSLTPKRKQKAASLAKFKNKRDEFLALLLQLMSDPEISTPKRMKRLEAIYQVIGLDPQDIHSDMHRLATSSAKPAKSKGTKSTSGTAAIDRNKLREMAQSTEQAQQILADVFTDQDETPPAVASNGNTKRPDSTLDILKVLITNEQWPRSEFDRLCREYGQTAGSMLELLNDLSYEAVDDAVAEDDDDTIYIDIDVAKQLL